MKNILPAYLQEVIDSSQLTGKECEELEKELLSHHFMATRDLEQKGVRSEDFENKLSEQFGNSKVIAMEIKKVHWEWSLTKKIIFYISLAVIFSGPAGVLLWSAMNIFTLTFIIITLLAGACIYFLLLLISTRKQLNNKPIITSSIIISLVVIVQWVILIFSERGLLQQDIWKDPMSVAGFPFKSLYFPSPPLGGDYVPFSMWPKFYLNYGFWLFVIILVYPLLPSCYKNKKIQKRLLIIASVVSLLGCCYLLLKFD
jgi:hypothetical protein